MDKGRLAIIIGKMKKARGMEEGGEKEGSESKDWSMSDGAEEAAQGLIDAVKGGDASQVVSAFKSLMTCCSGEDSEEENYEEED